MFWTPKSLKLLHGSQAKMFGELSGGLVEISEPFFLLTQ